MNSRTLEHHYTGIAANLLLTKHRNRLKTLLVTSAVDGEGKSTTAYNLGRVLALAGKKTLLMDANVRNPALGDLLGENGEAGLIEVLAGTATPDQTVLRNRDVPGLGFLPVGQADSSGATLLITERFAQRLEELASSYEFVLIDGASILGDMTSLVLTPLVDGVLLVVRCDRTQKGEALQARGRILALGGTLLGVTLNRVPAYVPAGMRA